MTTRNRVGCLLLAVSLLILASACGGGAARAPVAPTTPPASSTADASTTESSAPPPRPVPPTPVDDGEDIPFTPDPDDISERTLRDLNDPEHPLLDDVYYGFDSASLDARARAVLDGHASILNRNPGLTIMIEGHCDERGTVEYNLALGERRANQAYNYLMSLGIDASRMKTITYGKEFPADPGHNEQAWAKNRRARFEITGK